MGQRTDRDKIYASVGVGADVLQSNAARTFQRQPLLQTRATVYCLSHIVDGHVVEQHGFGAMLQRLLRLFQRTDLDFNRLRAAPVTVSTLQRASNSARQGDVIIISPTSVGEIKTKIRTS